MRRFLLNIRSSLPKPLERLVVFLQACAKTTLRNLAYALRWQGQQPPVYLHHSNQVKLNLIWSSYTTCPPLRYAPYPFADLCHWVSNSFPRKLSPRKRHIIDIEHMLIVADRLAARPRALMYEWYWLFDQREQVRRFVEADQLRTILTFSAGLVEHFKLHLDPDLWHKLRYIYPSVPSPPPMPPRAEQPFTLLVIASRYSDKGVPEALRTFEILRERHGQEVRLILVSQAVPKGCRLPAGIVHHDVPLMSPALRAEVYRLADVLFLPNYGETVACFPEAYAAGVPVITTRIHHGSEFVHDGLTGYLLDTPIHAFSEKFGTQWKTAKEFIDELERLRGRGELNPMIEQSVDRLEEMISGRVDPGAMRRAAQQFYEDRFTPERRNEKLRALYAADSRP